MSVAVVARCSTPFFSSMVGVRRSPEIGAKGAEDDAGQGLDRSSARLSSALKSGVMMTIPIAGWAIESAFKPVPTNL